MNENKPAFDTTYGLTKRELIAALALQGLLANPGYANRENDGQWYEDAKIDAVQQADNLLKQLKETNTMGNPWPNRDVEE